MTRRSEMRATAPRLWAGWRSWLRPASSPAWSVMRAAPVACGALLLAVSGCQSDGLTPGKQVDRSELYWALTLNHHAVTLATTATPPYDTLALVATPRTVDGVPLAGFPAATYLSRDPERVAVTTDGVLHSIAPTTQLVWVVATLTAGNLKHMDSVQVKVMAVDAPPVLASLSIHPVPPDSAKLAIYETGSCFALPTTAIPPFCTIVHPVSVLDTGGSPIAGVPVAFHSSEPATASVEPDGTIRPGDRHLPSPSSVIFDASTTVFGITKADTLPFRIGYPVRNAISMSRSAPLEHPDAKLGVGAVVTWVGQADDTIDVTFADPTDVAPVGSPPDFWSTWESFITCDYYALCNDGGNVVLAGMAPLAVRRFPVPGVYEYHSSAIGAGGRIVIVDER